jgi:asparagine synthase (glutamine-hydrolysing)
MRYAAVLTPGSPSPDLRQGLDAAARQLATTVRDDMPGVSLAAQGPQLLVAGQPRSGVVLGALYQPGDRSALAALSTTAQAAITAAGGRRLIDFHWGSYVAILAEAPPARIAVLHAPFGDLGCLVARRGGATLLASDVALLETLLGHSPAVAWEQLARHLMRSDANPRATCLEGVDQLRGGEQLTVDANGCAIETLWSPWDRPGKPFGDPAEAAARLRDAVRMSVGARLSGYRHPLLMLSGGLDSTIVASCLAHAGQPFTSLNLVSADPSGDERRYARIAAGAYGCACIEARRDPRLVDVGRSDAAWLPRPQLRSFIQDSARIAAAAAARVGADVVIDGGGGDNVFCSLQSVAPLADALRAGEPFGRVVALARSIAELAEVAELTVLRRAAHRAWLRRAPWRSAPDRALLTPMAADAARDDAPHPWLAAPDQLPGRTAYAALLVAAQGWAEGQDAARNPLTLSPLVAQPIVEVGLRIPSWFWFEDGGNRSIARKAFADALPPEIRSRNAKATPDSFVLELFERNRPAIRELLCGGLLAEQGLIDVAAIEEIVADRRPARDQVSQRIMRLVDAEAWARARSSGRFRAGLP